MANGNAKEYKRKYFFLELYKILPQKGHLKQYTYIIFSLGSKVQKEVQEKKLGKKL